VNTYLLTEELPLIIGTKVSDLTVLLAYTVRLDFMTSPADKKMILPAGREAGLPVLTCGQLNDF
jgi:hypothetical protein